MRDDLCYLQMMALKGLSREARQHLDSTAGSGAANGRNLRAFEEAIVVPGLPVPLNTVDTSINLFLHDYSFPIGVAPIGRAGVIYPNADTLLAQAAAKYRLPYIYSSVSSTGIGKVTKASGISPWYQLYIPRDTAELYGRLKDARDASCTVLVLTLDRPAPFRPLYITPQRQGIRSLASKHYIGWAKFFAAFGNKREALPCGTDIGIGLPSPETLDRQLGGEINWDTIARLRDEWQGKFLLKGVLDVSIAKRAVGCGVDGLIISNHGGRHLDSSPATLDALPRIAAAVGGDIPLLIDSGVRVGSDVAKAVDKSALCCFLGRPLLYALAVGGAYGLDQFLEYFVDEVRNIFALSGRRSVYKS